MQTDIESLRRDNSLADAAARYGVGLQKDGTEWVACCPLHSEDTPSFTIFTGKDRVERFQCFGCGAAGDVLDFVQAIKGVDLREAIGILGGGREVQNVAPRRVDAVDVYAGTEPIAPSGGIVAGQRVRLFNPKRAGQKSEWGSFAPSAVYPYRRGDGSLIGYVLRHDLPDGGKETPMVMRARLSGGEECWCRLPFPKPRPLYGLEALREGQVFVVEGEKCKDAFSRATGRNVLSWAGGTHGIRHADWSPIAGRSVVIWPDADLPDPRTGKVAGIETAHEIASILTGLGCAVRVLDVLRGAA